MDTSIQPDGSRIVAQGPPIADHLHSLESVPAPTGNRHERRRLASLQRRQDRALRRILSRTDLPASGRTQILILRLAYRAWHLGRLTRRQARSLGCVV